MCSLRVVGREEIALGRRTTEKPPVLGTQQNALYKGAERRLVRDDSDSVVHEDALDDLAKA